MKRATALTLVITAAFLHGVTAASAEAGEASGGPRQRWDCVAFVTDDEEIYVVNLDGTGLTRLTATDAPDYSPTISPDGTKIAYVRVDEDSGHYAVYIMNVDGTDNRRLSPPTDVLEGDGADDELYARFYRDGDRGPVFTPDGERVAATRVFVVMGPWDYEIIFFPTSGGPEKKLYGKSDPAFSGDGRSIAFRVHGDCAEVLCMANADGSGARLLSAPLTLTPFALSPDGKKLAFNEWPEEGRQFCVTNADGTGWRLLSKGDRDKYPVFSPDGKKIIYSSSVWRGPIPVDDIYIMNADGSERRALTRTPVDESSACFTPDGLKIVFYAWPFMDENSAEPGIYIMNADGSGRRFLVAGGGFSVGPSLVEGRLLDSYGNWHDVVE